LDKPKQGWGSATTASAILNPGLQTPDFAATLGSNGPAPNATFAMHSTGFTLATVLIFGSGLFVLATLFFGTKGGYYDTDDYEGNGTAH
jgi:hypothetical protein